MSIFHPLHTPTTPWNKLEVMYFLCGVLVSNDLVMSRAFRELRVWTEVLKAR